MPPQSSLSLPAARPPTLLKNVLTQKNNSHDQALIAQILAGGAGARSAQGALYLKYRGDVLRVTSSYSCLDADEAADIVQESFVRAFRALHSLKSSERFSSWIFSIAKNRTRSYLVARDNRRKLAEEAIRDALLTSAPLQGASERLALEADCKIVRNAIESLRAGPEKITIQLFYLEGLLTAREIAQKMNVGKSAVTMRLERFRARVRTQILALCAV